MRSRFVLITVVLLSRGYVMDWFRSFVWLTMACLCVAKGASNLIKGQANVTSYFSEILFTQPEHDISTSVVNIVFIVYFEDSSSYISGDFLWQLELYTNENIYGTGTSRLLSPQLLNQNQFSTGVRPGGQLRFNIIPPFFDLDNFGAGDSLPYLCAVFKKHPLAVIEVNYRGSSEIISCFPIPRLAEETRTEVKQNIFDISFTRTDRSSRKVNSVANFDVMLSSFDVTNDNSMWQLKMFASQNFDGTGKQKPVSTQILHQNQISAVMLPGGRIRFTICDCFDLSGIGPGTQLPFMCLSLKRLHSSYTAPYLIPQDDVKECRALPSILAEQTLKAVVKRSEMKFSFIRTDPSSTYVVTNVNFGIIFDSTSDEINGDSLWQLKLFASQNIHGEGRQRTISRQILDEYQSSTGVLPGGVVHFMKLESLDFAGLGSGTPLPYICLSLQKHPTANFKLVYRGKSAITGCRKLPLLAQNTPRAVVTQSNSEISIQKSDPSSSNSEVIINFNVTFDTTSDVVRGGEPLWQLSLLASQNIDGTGKLRTLKAHLLHENQTLGDVTPGGELQFTAKESVDIKGFTSDSSLPFVCILLQKHKNAKFDILFGGKAFVMECQKISALAPQRTPKAVVRQRNSEIFISKNDPSSPTKSVIINFNITLADTSDVIEDEPVWQLSMLASQNADGTGKLRTIATQTLNPNQTLGNITPGGELQFTAKDSIDIKGLESDTSLPYICLLLQKDQDTGFDFLFEDKSYVMDCQNLSALLTTSSVPMTPSATLVTESETVTSSVITTSSESESETVTSSVTESETVTLSVLTTPSVIEIETVTPSVSPTPTPSEAKTCRIWGDPHQKTFDGYGYSFQGEAEYIAVKSCKDDNGTMPDFQIIAENFRRRPSKPVTFIHQLKLEYNGVRYTLSHPDTILVNDIAVTLPFSDANGVKIHIAPPHKILTTKFGLVIRLDESYNSDITLPVRFANRVCGICGNFDGIRGNECHYRNTTNMGLRNEKCKESFVQEWLFNTADTPYRENIKPLTPCDEGSVLRTTAEHICNIITDPAGPLASCHVFVSPDFYYETCVFDLCQLLPSTDMLCGHVEAYILECSQVTGGVTEVGYWRNVTDNCERYCREGMTFSYRGNPCPPTCDNPDGTKEDCPFPFLETCECDEGTVLDGIKCVNVSDCGCQMNGGRYLSIGEEFMISDCSESCLCTESREVECTQVTCSEHSECVTKSGKRDCYCKAGYSGYGREECVEADKICRIYGLPHLTTFDQAFHSFEAGCVYRAVRTCETLPTGVFHFQIHFENDVLVSDELYTFITFVRLHFKEKSYRISYTGEVTIDRGRKITSLPFRDVDTGVNISNYKKSIILLTDGGLHINLTSGTEVTIKLPPVYFGKVCGLCGNANGNSTGDEQQAGGTDKHLSVANSWIIGSCTQKDEPTKSCVIGSEEEATAIDVCSDIVRKDGPFAHCYDFRDPINFYQSCFVDLCPSLPSTEMFCVNANQYLQACMRNGGSVEEDWKKDVEYCSSVKCTEGYTAFKGSCYKYYRTKKTFDESKVVCSGRGGHLVTITSQAENDFISRLAEETRSWIGAERNHSASFKTFMTDGNSSYKFLPESIPRGVVSLRFGVITQSSAYIILSPTRNPNETTSLYKFKIGSNQTNSFIRRCMSCPEEDIEQSLLQEGRENRFFVNFNDGVIALGKYKKRGINLHHVDENPVSVKYIAIKTVGTEGTWNFYDNEFMWTTHENWAFENFRYGEPSNFNDRENCLETNYDSIPGTWNDHFCSQKKPFVCELGDD